MNLEIVETMAATTKCSAINVSQTTHKSNFITEEYHSNYFSTTFTIFKSINKTNQPEADSGLKAAHRTLFQLMKASYPNDEMDEMA